jgi:hypothetical protein
MLKEDFYFSLFDFALTLSGAVDAISPALVNHQKRATYKGHIYSLEYWQGNRIKHRAKKKTIFCEPIT